MEASRKHFATKYMDGTPTQASRNSAALHWMVRCMVPREPVAPFLQLPSFFTLGTPVDFSCDGYQKTFPTKRERNEA